MKTVLMAAILTVSTTASALSLKEKKMYADWQAQVKDPSKSYAPKVKEKCGIDISANIEEAMVGPFMTANYDAGSICNDFLWVIADMCEDATAKAEIVKKINKFECKNNKPSTLAFKLNGKTFEAHVGPGAVNTTQEAKTFLENNL